MASTRGRQVVLPLVNKSGGQVVAGDVVVNDSGNDGAFTTTTSASESSKWVGVAQETIANNATGRVLLAGYAALVNVNASVTRGHFAFTHTVAKQASGSASRAAGAFGQYLTGGTTPTATLWGFPDSSSAGGGAPSTAQYVVGAADGTLSAEIVVTAPAASGVIPVVKYKSADETVSASNSLQNDDHLSFAIAANEKWCAEFVLFTTGSSDSGDIVMDCTGPSGATFRWAIMGPATNATNNESSLRHQAHTTGSLAAGVVQSAIIDDVVRFFVYVANSTNAGTVQFRWAQNTASGTTTVKEGSWMVAHRVA